jgi:hypothetical protein
MPSEANSPTVRTALYARFSSDLQREASIDDQLRICAEWAAKQGWLVVERYSDGDHSEDPAAPDGTPSSSCASQKCWVTETNDTPCRSNTSTSFAKSVRDRLRRSTL